MMARLFGYFAVHPLFIGFGAMLVLLLGRLFLAPLPPDDSDWRYPESRL